MRLFKSYLTRPANTKLIKDIHHRISIDVFRKTYIKHDISYV